jgi:hypothetical protein
MRTLLLSCCLLALGACLSGQDDPTTVKDLRVLGLSFEPPELMLEGCNAQLLLGLAQPTDGGLPTVDPALLAKLFVAAAQPLAFRALIADPAGAGRPLEYTVRACASSGDRTCNQPGEVVELARGSTTGGELSLSVLPAAQLLADGTPLLLRALELDGYKGLGGIRLPLVLELISDTGEHVFAQKLMVYSCQLLPQRKANLTPRLPGLTWRGERWPEDEVKEHAGQAGVAIEPEDFTALEESYVEPSLALEPVELEESWKLNWMTTSGTFGAYGTGGTDFSGETGRHQNTWRPDPTATEPREVSLSFVVRDGRGGESWLTRRVRWTP